MTIVVIEASKYNFKDINIHYWKGISYNYKYLYKNVEITILPFKRTEIKEFLPENNALNILELQVDFIRKKMHSFGRSVNFLNKSDKIPIEALLH